MKIFFVCFLLFTMNIGFTQITNIKVGVWSDETVWENNLLPTDISNIVLNYDITVDINAVCKSLNTNGHNVIVNSGIVLNISGSIDSNLAKTVFISGSDTLYSFNGKTGLLNWKKYLGDDIFHPVYSNGNLYGINKPGTKILCYDTLGNYKWSINSSAGTHNRKLIPFNNSIIIGDTSGVYSYNASNGELLWNFLKSAHNNGITRDSNTLYLAVNGSDSVSGIYALNPSTGEIKWKNPYALFVSCIEYGNNKLFTIEGANNLVGYNATNGTVVWGISDIYIDGDYEQDQYITYGNLYMFDSEHSYLTAIDISTGNPKWSNDLSCYRLRVPIVLDSVLYFANISSVNQYDPFTGQYIGPEINVPSAIAGGISVASKRVYIATANTREGPFFYYGTLSAYDGTTGDLKWQSIEQSDFSGPPCVLTQSGKIYIGGNIY